MAKLVKKGSRGAKGEVELQDHPSAKPVEGIAEIGFDVSAPEPAAATKSKYPLVEGPAIAKLADRIIELGEKFDAVADPFKAAKMEMTELAMPQFFEKNRGRVEAPSSMIAQGTKGGVRVTFKDKFSAGDKQALYAILGPDKAAEWFRQYWEVKIKSDDIPPEVGPALINDLKAVMAKHGVSHALGVKAQILPKPEFAAKRHFVFDVATNLEIQKVVPQQAAVGWKGVK
jgi:hypothetical protein